MSNLSDIGFPVQSEQDVNEMITMILEKQMVEQITCPNGFYYKSADESGAEIYLQGNSNQELIGFNPHYAGKSSFTVCLTKAVERDSSELDGGFFAWANPRVANEPETGEYPFVFDVPDFRVNENMQFPRNARIQLTAFASNDFNIYESEAEFNDALEMETDIAVKSFAASGLFMRDEAATPIEPPRPIGVVSGVVKEYELKQNQMTNEKFYWFLIETRGGEIDLVADQKLISGEPRKGEIVRAHCWLSGRIIE